jgi:hypothetical protein
MRGKASARHISAMPSSDDSANSCIRTSTPEARLRCARTVSMSRCASPRVSDRVKAPLCTSVSNARTALRSSSRVACVIASRKAEEGERNSHAKAGNDADVDS